jgi:hypothetical protein
MLLSFSQRLEILNRELQRERASSGLISQSGCKRSVTNEYLMDCGNCWANKRVHICSWPVESDPPPGVPSELPSQGALYVPPPPLLSPVRPSLEENELYDLMDKTTRELEKLTRQPAVR